MKTRVYPFIAAIVTGLSLISCSCGSGSKNQDTSSEKHEPVEKRWSPPISHPSEDISFYWNEWDEYGTYFPTILGDEIDLPENLKGFGVKNEDCEFYADYMHDYLDDNGEMKVAHEVLRGHPGPEALVDTAYVEGNFIVMSKYVVCDERFFHYGCKFLTSKEQTYGKLFRQCMDKFPEFSKRD